MGDIYFSDIITTSTYSEPIGELHKAYFEKGEDGWIVATIPDLNIVTQGKTMKEAANNLIDCIQLMSDV